MRQIPGRALWVGHAGDLRNARGVLNVGISAVVELADNEPFANLPRDLVRGRFPLADGGENPIWLLRLAAETVAVCLKADVATLVCCSAGMNRSVCVAAGGIALAEGRPMAEALRLVAESGPVDVSPGLFIQLKQALSE